MAWTFNPFTGKLDYYITGVPGVPGADGAVGRPGSTIFPFDPEDPEEPFLLPGPAGAVGSQGTAGSPGTSGRDGQILMPLDPDDPEEPFLVPGRPGDPGAPGAPGAPGVGIQGPAGAVLLPDEPEQPDEPMIIPGPRGATGAAGVGGGGLTFTTIEEDLGEKAKKSGTFDITGLSGLTPDAQVLLNQAHAIYTGKGSLKDEVEMNQATVSGYVLDTTTIRVRWACNFGMALKGNVKFNYAVSA